MGPFTNEVTQRRESSKGNLGQQLVRIMQSMLSQKPREKWILRRRNGQLYQMLLRC